MVVVNKLMFTLLLPAMHLQVKLCLRMPVGHAIKVFAVDRAPLQTTNTAVKQSGTQELLLVKQQVPIYIGGIWHLANCHHRLVLFCLARLSFQTESKPKMCCSCTFSILYLGGAVCSAFWLWASSYVHAVRTILAVRATMAASAAGDSRRPCHASPCWTFLNMFSTCRRSRQGLGKSAVCCADCQERKVIVHDKGKQPCTMSTNIFTSMHEQMAERTDLCFYLLFRPGVVHHMLTLCPLGIQRHLRSNLGVRLLPAAPVALHQAPHLEKAHTFSVRFGRMLPHSGCCAAAAAPPPAYLRLGVCVDQHARPGQPVRPRLEQQRHVYDLRQH